MNKSQAWIIKLPPKWMCLESAVWFQRVWVSPGQVCLPDPLPTSSRVEEVYYEGDVTPLSAAVFALPPPCSAAKSELHLCSFYGPEIWGHERILTPESLSRCGRLTWRHFPNHRETVSPLMLLTSLTLAELVAPHHRKFILVPPELQTFIWGFQFFNYFLFLTLFGK